MTLQEQTTIRTKMQLGIATEAEVVELVTETFDAQDVSAVWRIPSWQHQCPWCRNEAVDFVVMDDAPEGVCLACAEAYSEE